MNNVNCVPRYCESCHQIHVLTKPCPAPADECKLCHASMSTREGCEPTEVCDNCAQAAYSAQSAEVERLSKEIENLIWNLGGCDTIASGWSKPFDYNKEMARPALDSVSRLATKLEAAESQLSQLQLAVRNVYFAGVWSCSRPVDEVKLWTELRDAAGFKPGESTAMNGGGQ